MPAIHLTNVKDKRTQTLVLCPTRELCMQITKDLTNYSKNIKGLGIVAVYGGASIQVQIKALNKEAQIVVATPGRAKDLIKRKKREMGILGNPQEIEGMDGTGFLAYLNMAEKEPGYGKQTATT